MNTKQKAEAWLADYDTRWVFVDAGNAQEIITALLKERQALLDALKAVDLFASSPTSLSADHEYVLSQVRKTIQQCEESK